MIIASDVRRVPAARTAGCDPVCHRGSWRLDDQLQLLADAGWPMNSPSDRGPQAGVDIALTDGQRRRHLPLVGFLRVLFEPTHGSCSFLAQHGQRGAKGR